jgi:hypothetical protein
MREMGCKKDSIDKHPIVAYLKEGRKKEPGWMRYEETAVLKNNKGAFKSRCKKYSHKNS